MDQLSAVDVDIERDDFMLSVIRELAGALESIAGPQDAESYISLVGQSLGQRVNSLYIKALSADRLSRDQAAEVMVDFARRIGGDFYVIEGDGEKIVLGNRVCPFTEKVAGRESICMMTSNVLGAVAADNLGYARVELEETIARGYPGCRIVVHLRPSPDARAGPGREYFGEAALERGPGEVTAAG